MKHGTALKANVTAAFEKRTMRFKLTPATRHHRALTLAAAGAITGMKPLIQVGTGAALAVAAMELCVRYGSQCTLPLPPFDLSRCPTASQRVVPPAHASWRPRGCGCLRQRIHVSGPLRPSPRVMGGKLLRQAWAAAPPRPLPQCGRAHGFADVVRAGGELLHHDGPPCHLSA
jgi:hypothetical protein